MKIVLSVFSVMFLSLISIAQLSINETFGTSTGIEFVSTRSGWASVNSWEIEPTSADGGILPDQSSPSPRLLANEITAGLSTATFTFSAVDNTSITIGWNQYIPTGADVLTVRTSTDNFATSNTITISAPPLDAWGAITPFVLPTSYDRAGVIYIEFSYVAVADGNVPSFGIDDISITGTFNPINVFYSKSTGFLNNLATWGVNADGSGTAPTSFIGDNKTYNIVNNLSPTIGGNWAVSGASTTIKVGDGVTGINLTLPAASALTFTNSSGLIIANNSTVTLQNTTLLSNSTFSLGSNTTFVYDQASSVNLLVLPYHNLTISNSPKVAFLNYTVNGVLSLASNLSLTNNRTLTLNGTISGAGKLVAANTANIIIGGSGSFGTLAFSVPTATISKLTINRSSSGSVTLGSDLQANGGFTLTAGTIDISGKSLTINGAISSAAAGSILSSSTTSITVGGSGAITGSLNISSSIYDLTLNRSSQTLTLGSPLNIINSITPTAGTIASGGNVKLKNSAGQHSRIGVVGATGAITGNIIVENFIPGTVAGWRTLGSPGISSLKVSDWDGVNGSNTDFAMYCWGCTNLPTAFPTPFCSIQSNPSGDDATFIELSATDNLTPGQGFWVYDAISLTAAQNVTQTDVGPAFQGSMTTASATTKIFAANPYACPISLGSLQATNPTMGGVHCYDPVSMNYIDANGGIGPDIIPMGQGFYTDGNTAVTFLETHKVASGVTSTADIQKTMSPSQTSSLVIGAVFQLGITGFLGDYDKTYIRLHPNGTPGYDLPLDVYKKYGTPGYSGTGTSYSQYTNIATVSGNQNYSINSLSDVFTTNLIIPVVARAQVTGQYTISPIDIQNLPGNACVSLFDKLLNVTHDLRTGSYICNINDTTQAARFELTICLDQTVTSVNANNLNNNNVLIGQDSNAGVFVKTKFEKNMKSVISAYNLMGQKIINDKEIEGSENVTYLDFKDLHNQIVIIKVTNTNGQTTKKVYIN